MTFSDALFSPQPKDIQITVVEQEMEQKMLLSFP